MKKLKEFIEEYERLSDPDWDLIRSSFEKEDFIKNDFILEAGEVCKNFYFLESGLLRIFNLIDGNDITKTFVLAPYCFTSRTSFRNQIPSKEGIQCLDATTVWRTTFSQYQKLAEIDVWNCFIRRLINEIQEFADEFYLEAKILTSEQRYQILQDRYPADIIQKIPLKHLSTFLGIAPQSLSRIRKSYFKDKS